MPSSRKTETNAPPPATDLALIRPYFKKHLTRVVWGLTCLVVVDFLQLTIPRVVKNAVDSLTATPLSRADLAASALAIVWIAAGIGVFRYIWRRCLIGLSRHVETGLRSQLFSHVQTLSAADFSKIRTGDIMARATSDIAQVRMATGMGMVALTDAVVLGTAAVGFMLYIHVELTLLVLTPMPFIALTTRFFGSRMHRRSQEVQTAFATLTETVRERLAGIRIVKAYQMEAAGFTSVAGASRAYTDRQMHLVRVTRSFFPMMVFFSNLSMAIILYFGGSRTIRGEITAGDFVAFISYLGLLTWPMMALGWLTNLVQRGKASLGRIRAVLDTQPAIDPAAPGICLLENRPDIRVEDLWFAYPGNENEKSAQWALREVNASVAFGRFIGIAGPPGSGKSTFLRLLPRLYDPDRGGIFLGETDIRRIALDHVRRQFAVVAQEPFLFSGTLRHNVLSGASADDMAVEERLRRAAALASLLSTVESFPSGWDTVVGERGVMLSGGQKQRVALARAFASDAPVLVLDDPISQVDVETGKQIVQAIRSLAGTKTIFLASHRLSAIRDADEIFVFEKGRITARGDHDAHMARDGYYARSARLQSIEANHNGRHHGA